MSAVWHCDTPDKARTYATQREADAEERRIRATSSALLVVWFQADTIDPLSDFSGGVALGSTEVLNGPQIKEMGIA